MVQIHIPAMEYKDRKDIYHGRAFSDIWAKPKFTRCNNIGLTTQSKEQNFLVKVLLQAVHQAKQDGEVLQEVD